jgi:ATP-dependent DNA helicase DinG
VSEVEVGGGEDAALLAHIQAVFELDGPLAENDPQYRLRQEQGEFARAVGQALQDGAALVAEVGTGVGKTFAYLVPLLLSGKRALVSTATKSLQDQLYNRDLPRLLAALNAPMRTALLKGRSSYLCLHRLKRARQGDDAGGFVPNDRFTQRATLRQIARIEDWATRTTTGDVSEVEGMDERSAVIPLVTSTRDNCLGSECPDFAACHLVRARREAMAADIVVINHHLFFADLAVRDSGVAELLPSVEAVVFDEAHQLIDVGVQFSGTTLATAQVLDLARDALAWGLQHARGLVDWPGLSAQVERAARELRLACGGASAETAARDNVRRLAWVHVQAAPGFVACLQDMASACEALAQACEHVGDVGPDALRLSERARGLASTTQSFVKPAANDRVRWADVTAHHVRLIDSPLDIRDVMSQQRQRLSRSWIFTSATLGDDDALSWFTQLTALEDAAILRLGSPYDYATHARLWVPERLPKPNEAGHPAAVAAHAAACAAVLGGRTFVLTTTLRALSQIADGLRGALARAGAPHVEVLVQGTEPKRVLLARFLAQPQSVLVGSQSFWEGIDVVGAALQCVVIDKLPFPPPNDPLIEARAARVRAQGGEPFIECFVAEAAVSLKQGAGRLIRSESDCGLLVICDGRLSTMPYGRRLIAALPPMGRLASAAEAKDWLLSIRSAPAVAESAW